MSCLQVPAASLGRRGRTLDRIGTDGAPGDELAAALARLAGGQLEVQSTGPVVSVTRPPLGWFDAGVMAGAALLPPLLLVAFLRSLAAVAAGGLFVVVVVLLARDRARAMTNVRLDLAAATVETEHPNRRLASLLGARRRTVSLTEVRAVRLRSISMGGRYDPPGARVQLATVAGDVITVIDVERSADGRAVAAELALLLGKPVEGP